MVTLIIFTWMGGYVAGPIVTSVQFSSRDRCEAAAETIRREAKMWDIADGKLRVFCVLN